MKLVSLVVIFRLSVMSGVKCKLLYFLNSFESIGLYPGSDLLLAFDEKSGKLSFDFLVGIKA